MGIAEIGRSFSIGTLCVLAIGGLIWAVLKLRRNGFSIPPVLALIGATVLLVIAANFYLIDLS